MEWASAQRHHVFSFWGNVQLSQVIPCNQLVTLSTNKHCYSGYQLHVVVNAKIHFIGHCQFTFTLFWHVQHVFFSVIIALIVIYIIVHIVSSANSLQIAYYYLLHDNINTLNIYANDKTSNSRKYVYVNSLAKFLQVRLKTPISLFKTHLLVTLLHFSRGGGEESEESKTPKCTDSIANINFSIRFRMGASLPSVTVSLARERCDRAGEGVGWVVGTFFFKY